MADDSRKRSKRTSTWTRSKRSCQFCSSRKQRCELPQTIDNFNSIFTRCLDTSTKLPDELRCQRCQLAGRDCIPAVPGYGRQWTRGDNRPPATRQIERATRNQSQDVADVPVPSSSSNGPPSPDSREDVASSIPNTTLSGLIRDIPSENVSSALFPHCSGKIPKGLCLSPLAILPCLCKDVAPRQRELQALLAKYTRACCDRNASLHHYAEPEALQLMFDGFPGLDLELLYSIKHDHPILHDTLRNAVAFVATGQHQFLKGCSEGIMMTLLAAPASAAASLALVFYATYLPLEVAPIMPSPQDMNFTGFTDTVNAKGLLSAAGVCATRADLRRPSAIYLRLLNSELTRSFLLGQGLTEVSQKINEAKVEAATIQTTKETRIALAVCRCRVRMLECAFETQDYLNATFAAHEQDLTRWDIPTPLDISFTTNLRTKCRSALAAFSLETSISADHNKHPLWSALNALAARLELVLLLKHHYLTMDPLTSAYAHSSWRFVSERLATHSHEPKFQSIWRFRTRTQDTARRLLIHANDAFDTPFPTIMGSREMLTAVALASKQLLETHIGMLALKQHDESNMQRDAMLLRQTSASVGRAETILAKTLAGTVEAMAMALRTWLDKLVRLNVSEPARGSQEGASIRGRPSFGAVRQTATHPIQQQQQDTETRIPTPPDDIGTVAQGLPDLEADWDGVLNDLLGAELDWNWISF